MTVCASERAVVLLAHGSPDPRHRRGVEGLAARVRALADSRGTKELVLHAFLDHNAPSLDYVAAALLDHGVLECVVVPLLVTLGFHSRVDVPEAVARIAELAPTCAVALSQPFATDSRFVEALEELLGNWEGPATDMAGVLLIGSGSRDHDAQATLIMAADQLEASSGFLATAAFVDAEPSVREGHATLVERGCDTPVIAVSVVIADGIFRDRIASAASEVGAHLLPGTLVATEALAAFALMPVQD